MLNLNETNVLVKHRGPAWVTGSKVTRSALVLIRLHPIMLDSKNMKYHI